MNKLLNKIYSGAWNNLELSKSSKQAINKSAGIVGIGLITAIVILKRK